MPTNPYLELEAGVRFLISACGRWGERSSVWPPGWGFCLAVVNASWRPRLCDTAYPGRQTLMVVSVGPLQNVLCPIQQPCRMAVLWSGCGVCILAKNAERPGCLLGE